MSSFDDPTDAWASSDSGRGVEPAVPSDPPAPSEAPSDPAGPVPPAHPVREPDERLDRRVVYYWLMSGLLGWLFLALCLAGGALFVHMKWPRTDPYPWLGALVLGGLLLAWTVLSPYLAWERWRFRVDDELLIARFGILFIEEKAIPISRLQHVDLYRGAIERMFGLTTLIVFTAGTEGAHFRLPGLPVERARQLRDQILAARGDDVV